MLSEKYLMTPEAREEKSLPLSAFMKAEKQPIPQKQYTRNVRIDNPMERCVRKQSYVTVKDRAKACVEKPVGKQIKKVKKRKKTRSISFVLNEGEESRKVNFAVGEGSISQTDVVRASQSKKPKRSKRLRKCKLNLLEDN